jgi:hypothetical protein
VADQFGFKRERVNTFRPVYKVTDYGSNPNVMPTRPLMTSDSMDPSLPRSARDLRGIPFPEELKNVPRGVDYRMDCYRLPPGRRRSRTRA